MDKTQDTRFCCSMWRALTQEWICLQEEERTVDLACLFHVYSVLRLGAPRSPSAV